MKEIGKTPPEMTWKTPQNWHKGKMQLTTLTKKIIWCSSHVGQDNEATENENNDNTKTPPNMVEKAI